ncbi:hypothetical protein [Coleofasciculus sp. H7-2]|uniref:baeRF3 domain-containing protein n=1 Tax=Coleofasciculus sp. H7-2 TaxID=3351545 RepID=UPI0036713CC3
MEEGITGNPEIFKPEELHELALPIVEPLLQENIEEVVEEYKELAGKDTSQDLRKAYTYSVFSGSIPLWLPSDGNPPVVALTMWCYLRKSCK